MRLSVILAVALLYAPFAARSQDDISSRLTTIQGEILTADVSVANWTVEMIPSAGVRQRTSPGPDGSFSFDSVLPGPCQLRVTTGAGETVYEQFLTVHEHGERILIRDGSDAQPRESKARTVSVQELTHKVPRKAQSEFNKGAAALRKLKYAEAAAHYEATLAIDPDFAAAHNDLGVAYLKVGDHRRSVEQFEAAVHLSPGYQPATDNLCLLLIASKRYAAAGAAAVTLLKRGSGTAVTHYAAAVGLIAQRGSRYEILEHLKQAKDDIPEVRLLVAGVLADAGRRTEAVSELEAYLRMEIQNAKRPELEAWLAELKR